MCAAALVGSENYAAVVLVSVDASEEIPRSWLYVRARQNSILLLEPRGEHSTKATFCIEKDPGGWAVSPFLANLALGSTPALLLRDLKRALEHDESDRDAGLTPDQVALRNFKEKVKNQAVVAVDDTLATRETLMETISLLEGQLTRLRNTERTERLDLTELKDRVKSDLKRAKASLKLHK